MNMDKNIKVELRDAVESAQEFVKAWRRAEAGEPAEEPVERLYFQDLGGRLQVLTPRRLELLRRLHDDGRRAYVPWPGNWREITRMFITTFRHWNEWG